ncbi:MAG: response regulator [Chitinophaga sp.]|uniref:hybrid sensor histidine kinase/response regulator n=1 Tax=Chitinophaga sp. TaxID=1869181 RepID=UPI001B10E0B7|nr:hybrid sensor histidine kinase/response regulator [Chitinophaga sp.]MBO9728362.1 response regulator [Chitinophaga sp.]
METNNSTSVRLLKDVLLMPLFAGTKGLAKTEKRRSIITVNFMAIVLSGLVLGIGTYFYLLKNSIFFLIGIPLEVVGFACVIGLNYYKQYFQANLLMYTVNAIFIAYWSTVLGSGISLGLLLGFITIIIFHLTASCFLHKEKRSTLICLITTALFGSWVLANSYFQLMEPIGLSANIAATMRFITTIALIVFIVLVMLSYVSQINALLLSERQLKEISERKSVFLRETYHELRTPLNAIFSIAQLFQLKRDKYAEEDKKQLDDLYSSCYIARNTINHVLDMSKIESGRFYNVIKEPINLRECVAHCVAMNSYLAASRGIMINVNFDTALDQPINSDDLLLKKIFNNVLSNAVKFAAGKSIVEFTCEKKGENIHFKVRNDGAIDPKIADRIFDNFVSGRNQIEGTGLGLSITKHLVGLFEGSIALEPDEAYPNTTTIAFNIPLEISTEKVKQQTAFQFRKNCFAGATALIIEDDLLSSHFLSKILTEMGITPIVCKDGESAAEIIQQTMPNVIISDLNMPGFDGKQLLQYLHDTEELKGIPVLIVSGDAFLKDEMLQAGAHAFITKPVHFKELYLELSRHLPHHILS